MRKILTLLVMVFMTMVVVAQNNSVISYQAVVRDGQNRLAINEAVSVTISVLDANNTVQYTETENVTTNANGLISLNIGDGDPTAFAAINWIDAKFQTSINLVNLGYEVTSTAPVTSVPVALYALASGTSASGGANIPQTLSISGTTLTISEGNSVELPEGFSGDYNDLSNKPTIPTNVSTFANDAGYLTRDSMSNCACMTAAELQALLNRIEALEEAVANGNTGDDNSDDTTTTTDPNIAAQACPGTPTVTDVDGNVYNTVQIGEQCWMRENLKTTKYANGTTIPLGTTLSYDVAYRYYPDENSANVADYGYLYNWPAMMNGAASSDANPSGVQGICPNGWHVPSDAEWTQLTNYVKSQSQYVCGGDEDHIAKALASTEGWNTSSDNCAVGNNPSANNATGFSALPAGLYYGNYYYFGGTAYFWSAKQNGVYGAYGCNLDYSYALVYSFGSNKDTGFSVRCVRN